MDSMSLSLLLLPLGSFSCPGVLGLLVIVSVILLLSTVSKAFTTLVIRQVDVLKNYCARQGFLEEESCMHMCCVCVCV